MSVARPHSARLSAPVPSRRFVARVVACLSLVGLIGPGMVTPGLVSPASADIAQQIRDGQAQLDQINNQAEQAAEHYNAGRIALVKARQRSRVWPSRQWPSPSRHR